MDGLEDLKVELHVTLGEINLILGALSELPFKVSFQLIQKIKQQGEEQVAGARAKVVSAALPADPPKFP